MTFKGSCKPHSFFQVSGLKYKVGETFGNFYQDSCRRPPGSIATDPNIAFLNRHKSAVGIDIPLAALMFQPPAVPGRMAVFADVFRDTFGKGFVVTKANCDFGVFLKMVKHFTDSQVVPIKIF